MYRVLIRLLALFLIGIKSIFKSKSSLILENLALRQQLSAFLKNETSPKLTDFDRSFWVALKLVFNKWINSLMVVKPGTVIDWQNRRFKKHWAKVSLQKRPGRKRIEKEIRDLITRMAAENNWGAPRIYSELLMLGFTEISEATVSRYLRKYRSNHPDEKKQQSWMTFLRNHQDVISAMDFFIVPTIKFQILFVFFIIDHKRRVIRHYNVTNHPSALWVIQQLRDAIPFNQISKFMIMDRDKIFSQQVKGFLKRQLGVKTKVTSYKSPWNRREIRIKYPNRPS